MKNINDVLPVSLEHPGGDAFEGPLVFFRNVALIATYDAPMTGEDVAGPNVYAYTVRVIPEAEKWYGEGLFLRLVSAMSPTEVGLMGLAKVTAEIGRGEYAKESGETPGLMVAGFQTNLTVPGEDDPFWFGQFYADADSMAEAVLGDSAANLPFTEFEAVPGPVPNKATPALDAGVPIGGGA